MTPSNPNLLDTVDRALSALQSALTAREVYWAEHTAATTSARRAADLLADALRSNESIDVMFLDDRVICGCINAVILTMHPLVQPADSTKKAVPFRGHPIHCLITQR